ncbi:hypothetical protein PFLU4_57430 [Pseudomonas fluorescens]|nr:hypothetical protein PFLU4_57430 [Pseudomonas fluorescens]
MLAHALDGGRLEQIRGVGQGRVQALGAVAGVQAQVELRGALRPTHRLDGQVRQGSCQRRVGFVAMVEHGLEQRAVTQVALRLQGIDQLLERQILVHLRRHGRLLELLQQSGAGQVAVEFGSQHLGIDEKPDQSLGFQALAVGNRHPDANVGLAAVTVQQRLEGTEQQHEQRDVFPAGQGFEGVVQRAIEHDRQPCAAHALLSRTRMVGGQFQQRLFIAQLFGPVGQLPVPFTGSHPLPLPDGVVGVLHRQGWQLRGLALDERRVQAHQVIDHHLQRPGVGNDVMQSQHQDVLLLAQRQQADAQQRIVQQIERALRLLLDKCLDTGLVIHRQTLLDEVDLPLGTHHLTGPAIVFDEGGAQTFVTLQQRCKALTQGACIQRTAQPQRRRNIVGGAVGVHFPQEPLAFLGKGQWQRLVTRYRHQRQRLFTVAGVEGLHKILQRAVFEQTAQRHLDIQRPTDPRHHLGHQQRMSAQLEEVVHKPDTLELEYLLPDRRHLLLTRTAGRHIGTLQLAGIRGRQRLAIDLAVGRQRQLREEQQMRRHHVFRQLRLERGFERGAQ